MPLQSLTIAHGFRTPWPARLRRYLSGAPALELPIGAGAIAPQRSGITPHAEAINEPMASSGTSAPHLAIAVSWATARRSRSSAVEIAFGSPRRAPFMISTPAVARARDRGQERSPQTLRESAAGNPTRTPGLPVILMSPWVTADVQPTSSTVLSMPGIDTAAPERTETRSGRRRSPNFLPVAVSRKAMPSSWPPPTGRSAAPTASAMPAADLDWQHERGRYRQAQRGDASQMAALEPTSSSGHVCLRPSPMRRIFMAQILKPRGSAITCSRRRWPTRARRSVARSIARASSRMHTPPFAPPLPSTSPVMRRSASSAACSMSIKRRGGFELRRLRRHDRPSATSVGVGGCRRLLLRCRGRRVC